MVSRIIAAVDAEYAEVTRVRVRRAMRQLAVEGRPNGGRVFGFVPAVGEDGRRTRIVVPEEAEAIRWAADQLLAGQTLAAVARAFEDRGITHVRKGRYWSPTHIRNLVTNPAVAGLRPDPEGNLIAAIWPAILDGETWRAVRATQARPVTLIRSDGVMYRTSRARRPSRRHLLTGGLAVCGICDTGLAAQLRKRPSGEVFVSYLCDPRRGGACVGIVAHFLERHVTEALFAALADPATRRRLTAPDRSTVESIARELDRVEADLGDLARQWGRGELCRVEWDAARAELVHRRRTLDNRLRALDAPALSDLSDLPTRWDGMAFLSRRAVLAAVFERIVVQRATTRGYDPGRITLLWRITPVPARES